MCIAVFVPPGKTISEDYLRNCWDSNSDGAGFAYIRKKKVKIEKGFMKWDDFKTAWDARTVQLKASPFLLHFRIQSQGAKDAERTHPFEFPTGAMIHNGNITGTGAIYGTGPSDTELFVKQFGAKFNAKNIKDNLDKWNTAVGWNKLVFLFDSGEHVIVNEKTGVWEDGVWFSTSAFRHKVWRGNRCNVS